VKRAELATCSLHWCYGRNRGPLTPKSVSKIAAGWHLKTPRGDKKRGLNLANPPLRFGAGQACKASIEIL
jgi:hypothetical protein